MKNILNRLKIEHLLHFIVLMMIFSTNIFSMYLHKKSKVFLKTSIGESKRKEAAKKSLLIFLDDQEKDEFGAISHTLLIALLQEACPIIASTSLLSSIREYWEKDNRSIGDLLNEIKKKKEKWYPITNENRSLVTEERKYFEQVLLSKKCFKEENWIIKKINNSLNLLIPVKYLTSSNIASDKIKEFDSSMGTTISEDELRLGLKVNHMETVSFRSVVMPKGSYFSQFFSDFSTKLADYLVDSLDDIFVKKSDYFNLGVKIPEWTIFIDGHGAVNRSIAYLSLDGFKRFLSFLDNKIITQLLVVSSCYVAGVNVNKIYGELKLGTQEHYSFPIIVMGLNDIATSGDILHFGWHDKRLEIKMNFDAFVKRSKTLDGAYDKIVRPLWHNVTRNIPQIKLPHIEWFSLMDVGVKVVSIGSILAQTRNLQIPLDLTEKKPKIILLYTDNIPFELKIDCNALDIFGMFSMTSLGVIESNPEFVVQRIKKISDPKSSAFLILRKLVAESKWFFVDEVEGNDGIYRDVLVFTVSKERDLVGKTHAKYYFKDEKGLLFIEESWKYDKKKAGFWDTLDYNSKMNTVRDYLKLSEKKQTITPEQTEKTEEALAKKLEMQKSLKEAYTVSEPDVD